MKKIFVLLAWAAVSACAGPQATAPATVSHTQAPAAAAGMDAKTAIANAETQIKAAKQMNALWLNTDKVLEDAKKAEQEGDNDKALKLAQKATKQATLAQQQARENANAKPHYPE